MSSQPIFERAAGRAGQQGLGYAGAVTPEEAHDLHQSGQAAIVDVRTQSEFVQVGHIPGTKLIEWRRDGEQHPDPRFVERLVSEFPDKDAPLLLLCRSGVRSHYAAQLATQAGFTRVYNILSGFEQGWRPAGLPWERG